MADRITLNFAANTEDVERGTDRIADNLDGVSTKLDDVGNTGEASGQKAAGGLEDVGDSADDAGGKLGDLGNVGRDVLEGDIGGAAESAAGALSGLGPAGALAGTIAAAGIGLVTKAVKDQEEEVAALRARFSTLYRSAIEDGSDFITESQILKEALDILWDPARADDYNEAVKTAAATGVDLNTAIRAQVGDQGALSEVLTVSASKLDDVKAKTDAYLSSVRAGSQGAQVRVPPELQAQQGALEGILATYGDIGAAQDDSAAKSVIAKQIIAESSAEQQRGIDAATERYEALAAAQDKASKPPAIKVEFDVDEDGVNAAISRLERRRIRIPVQGVDQYGRTIQ